MGNIMGLCISGKSVSAASRLARLLEDESGQDLIEYALVAALIGLGAVVTVKSLGTKIAGAFTNIGTTLTTNT